MNFEEKGIAHINSLAPSVKKSICSKKRSKKNMANYDFSTLNDKDLEILVCDLFTREFSVNFQSFKAGKDKGIDLRYSTNNSENEIIVQVKHYLVDP
ncbi:MAG: hypothetical protein EOM47_14825 [Bacteroidia bacterium]|nr:hypothetical protein [Bacteroidia bacterium]